MENQKIKRWELTLSPMGMVHLHFRDLAVKRPARRYRRPGPRTPPGGRRIDPVGIGARDSRGS
jgi:hypothetical protein